MPVVDFDAALDLAKKARELGLHELRIQLEQLDQNLAKRFEPDTLELKIGGFQFILPAVRDKAVPLVTREERKTIGPNELCPCGSGLQYRRCCRAISS